MLSSQHVSDLRVLLLDSNPAPRAARAAQTLLMDDVRRRVPHVTVCPQRRLSGTDDLEAELQRVVEAGGEGLMLREPYSQYEFKRSFSMLKVKRFFEAEAKARRRVPILPAPRSRVAARVIRCGQAPPAASRASPGLHQLFQQPPVACEYR